jgi:hypothetical protein
MSSALMDNMTSPPPLKLHQAIRSKGDVSTIILHSHSTHLKKRPKDEKKASKTNLNTQILLPVTRNTFKGSLEHHLCLDNIVVNSQLPLDDINLAAIYGLPSKRASHARRQGDSSKEVRSMGSNQPTSAHSNMPP